MTPGTVARQAPLYLGFPRQEYRSRLLFLSPGTGIEPPSPILQADSLWLSHQGGPLPTLLSCSLISFSCLFTFKATNKNMEHQNVTKAKGRKGRSFSSQKRITKIILLLHIPTLALPFLSSFPCGSAGKKSACNAGDLGSIPGLGRSHGEGKGYPLRYSGLE